jgi:hypothetical protein
MVIPKMIFRKVNKTAIVQFGRNAVHLLIKKYLYIKEITMPKPLSLIIFTLAYGLLILNNPVRAEQNTTIHMAASSKLQNTEHNTSHFMSPPTMLTAKSELDNTEQNARDKGNTMLTPENQKETKRDIKITSKIRQAVVRDKSLSVDAQNAKIITRNGVVTLRGPVASEVEKLKLQQITQQTKGVVQVDNQLENKAL